MQAQRTPKQGSEHPCAEPENSEGHRRGTHDAERDLAVGVASLKLGKECPGFLMSTAWDAKLNFDVRESWKEGRVILARVLVRDAFGLERSNHLVHVRRA